MPPRNPPQKSLGQYLGKIAKKALVLTVRGKDPDPKDFSSDFKHGGKYPGYMKALYTLRDRGSYTYRSMVEDGLMTVPHFEAHLVDAPALAANKKNVQNMEKSAEMSHWPVIVFSLPDLGNEAAFSSKWVYLGKTRTEYRPLPGIPRREQHLRSAWGHVPLDTWVYVPGASTLSKTLCKNIAKSLVLANAPLRAVEKRTAAELAKYHFPKVPKEYQESVANMLMEAYSRMFEEDEAAYGIYTQAKELAALVAE